MGDTAQCPICQANAPYYITHSPDAQFFQCPVCGRYEWSTEDHFHPLNKNQLSAYLVYHAIHPGDSDARYYTTLPKRLCDQYNQDYRDGNVAQGRPIHIDADIIASWYPKTFAEKIDHILLYIHKHAPHIGQSVHFAPQALYSFLFVDRYDIENGQYVPRENSAVEAEAKFVINCLIKQDLIASGGNIPLAAAQRFVLTPRGYARIDEIQKYAAHGKNVLVAMKFGEETKPLRESIRKGIQDAGYIAIFIDEVQHNDFITPELLKHIRDSKFVVVDLTHQNNGAYFEEGYAMGLGKPVIQLCKEGVELHFDIAQKNTIMWKTEDDIPELLHRRIDATID